MNCNSKNVLVCIIGLFVLGALNPAPIFAESIPKDYFPLYYYSDGYKATTNVFSNTEYADPNMQDHKYESLTYTFNEGTQILSNTECIKSYLSIESFNSNKYSISYLAIIGDLQVTLGSDSIGEDEGIISSIRYEPYMAASNMGMDIGDSYSYRYTATVNSENGSYTSKAHITIKMIGFENISTHYSYYENTLKWEQTTSSTTTVNGESHTNTGTVTHWSALGKGIVRISTKGDGYTVTTDYDTDVLSMPPDSDTDNDDVIDSEDNCPQIANPEQTDSDNDNVGDACDGCPNDPNKTSPGACGCGEVDIDSDNDEVYDCNDAFPNDGTEWADNDNDTLGDNADLDDDNDSMPDEWENSYGLDPYVNDADEDDDADGYTNLEEYEAQTIPNDPNSFSVASGDINGDKSIDIRDLILSLKCLTNVVDETITIDSDVNDDEKISMEEAIFILQYASGFRQ